MEKNFVTGLQITQKDGKVTQFTPETQKEHALIDSLASALGKEAQENGKIEGFLLAIPREEGISVGLGGSGMTLIKGFCYLKKAILNTVGPEAAMVIDIMSSDMLDTQEDKE